MIIYDGIRNVEKRHPCLVRDSDWVMLKIIGCYGGDKYIVKIVGK